MLVGQTIGSGTYRFEIEKELGSGAMGMVYQARFHMDGKVIPVALKMVSLGLLGNEAAMARFEREANILKQLRHPNIVRMYACGQFRKMPFIAMEFIDGESLDRVLARRGRLSWEEVAAYGKQLCAALQHAHDKGIIHRDLKPSNIMVTRDGVLKLTDFGIAKDIDVTALTAQNSTIGTAAYMSPEQCKGDRNLTHKSDLYSLGVVFFELLTGKKPFTAETTVDMFLKHVHEPPPRPSRLAPEIPPKLDALILQLMEKDKEERPTDAAWVGRMLQEIEEDAVALRSAGEQLLHSRNLDRPRHADGSRLDEEDREALRALRGKKRKVRKRGVQREWWERPAVQGAGLLAGLMVVVAGAWWALRPPSPQSLLAKLEAAATPEERLAAATDYLKRYGDRDDDAAARAAVVFRDLKVKERDRVLLNRFQRGWSQPIEDDDAEAYRIAWKALEHEKTGALVQAEEQWQQLYRRFAEEAKLPFTFDEETLKKARWGWLALAHLEVLESVKKETARLRKLIENNREFEVAFDRDLSRPEALAVFGLRLEDFGDREKAHRVWNRLAELTEKDTDARVWHLLAQQQKLKMAPSAMPTNPLPQRQKRVDEHLNRARQLAAAIQPDDPAIKRKRANVRILCRDLIDLYADEEDAAIQQMVQEAQKLLQDMKKE